MQHLENTLQITQPNTYNANTGKDKDISAEHGLDTQFLLHLVTHEVTDVGWVRAAVTSRGMSAHNINE